MLYLFIFYYEKCKEILYFWADGFLEAENEKPKEGSVYECESPFKFVENYEDDDDEDDCDWGDSEEEDYDDNDDYAEYED